MLDRKTLFIVRQKYVSYLIGTHTYERKGMLFVCRAKKRDRENTTQKKTRQDKETGGRVKEKKKKRYNS